LSNQRAISSSFVEVSSWSRVSLSQSTRDRGVRRDLAAVGRLDPIQVEEEGGGKLAPCCRLGELGPADDGADRARSGACGVERDELRLCAYIVHAAPFVRCPCIQLDAPEGRHLPAIPGSESRRRGRTGRIRLIRAGSRPAHMALGG